MQFICISDLFSLCKVRIYICTGHSSMLFMQISLLAMPWVASSPGSLLKTGGEEREPGNIQRKSCQLPAPLLWRYQSQCRTKPCVHMAFWIFSKKLSTQNPQRLVRNSFRMCGRDASPESPRSKFTVVGLRDWLTHHTSQLRVYMYKVLHRTQKSWGCLEDEQRNCE